MSVAEVAGAVRRLALAGRVAWGWTVAEQLGCSLGELAAVVRAERPALAALWVVASSTLSIHGDGWMSLVEPHPGELRALKFDVVLSSDHIGLPDDIEFPDPHPVVLNPPNNLTSARNTGEAT